MPPDDSGTLWFQAQRALSCSKPRCRTLEQIQEISNLLARQAIFHEVDRDDLLGLAFFMEAKHFEAGECVLSKGEPLEQWCLLLGGSVILTRYSSSPDFEPTANTLGPNDSWGEVGLLHSTHLRRSSITVVAGQQGCLTLRLRYTDLDALLDTRTPLQLQPPEGTSVAGPELTLAQRRAAYIALMCCCLRRLSSARPLDLRTPEEASEIEPFIACLPPYRGYPPELVACLAGAARSLSLPSGSMVYEHSTLADAMVTVLSGEVQLRAFGDGGGSGAGTGTGGLEDGEEAAWNVLSGILSSGDSFKLGLGSGGSRLTGPSPPPMGAGGGRPWGSGGGAGQPQEPSDASGARLSIRARLRREREARKLMQRQLDEYVSRMEDAHSDGGESEKKAAAAAGSTGPEDWTRVFMQKAMRTVEPVWKALHPADELRRRMRRGAQGDTEDDTGEGPSDEGPITEVAKLLGPAAAKAYYRGLQSQGYSDIDVASGPGSAGSSSGGAGSRSMGDGGGSGVEASVGDRWRRWMFSVDAPETQHERTLRNVAMRASRINREKHALCRRGSVLDAEELDELYGPVTATITRGSPVGPLSIYSLHSTMRKESAVAGPGGCELLLVDWEAFHQGVLAARAALLARSAPFLASLPRPRLLHLAELCTCLCVDPGTLLARQGHALETVAVLQNGEVSLLHEPSAALHTRMATVKGHGVSRSRNGRHHVMPLLSTLGHAGLPTPASAAAASITGAFGSAATTSPFAAAAGAPAPASGTSSCEVEVTMQGLPLGDLGVGAVLGEGILGVYGLISADPRVRTASRGHGCNHSDSSHRHAATADGSSHRNSLGRSQASMTSNGHASGGGSGVGGGGSFGVALSAGSDNGPRWATTVIAARPTVLLVIPRSVFFMAEFDTVRSDLARFAVERKAWLSKRVEAAYREVAAPQATPAVYAHAAGGSGGGAGAGIQSPQTLRRSVMSVSSTASGGSTSHEPSPRLAVDASSTGAEGTSSNSPSSDGAPVTAWPPQQSQPHMPVFRRRSNNVLIDATSRSAHVLLNTTPRSTSPSLTPFPANGSEVVGGGRVASVTGGRPPSPAPLTRPNSKWDFLDSPTAAHTGNKGAGACEPSFAVAAQGSGNSFTRGPTPSLLDSAGNISIPSPTSPFLATAALVRRRSSELRLPRESAAGGAGGGGGLGGGFGSSLYDLSGLTPVQLALLEAGLNPNMFSEASGVNNSSGGAQGGGNGSIGGTGGSGPWGGEVSLSRGTSSALPLLTPSSSVTPAALPAQQATSQQQTPPPGRIIPPLRISLTGGGRSSCVDADGQHASPSGNTVAYRSSIALHPIRRVSYNGAPAGLHGMPPSPGPEQPINSFSQLPSPTNFQPSAPTLPELGGPSSRKRTSYGGSGFSFSGPTTRRTDADGATPISPRTGTATAQAMQLAMRLAALQSTDPGVDGTGGSGGGPGAQLSPRVPSSTRSNRLSYTGGGITPRVASLDSVWTTANDMTRRSAMLFAASGGGGGKRVSSSGGVAGLRGSSRVEQLEAEVEAAEEEEALARALIPRNQAGMFMVREHMSTSKQSAVRRLAHCF